MIHFSLFSGIGGFELAAQWMGWKNYVSCEIDDFCNKVRKYYWPDCFHHDNVKTLTFELINEKLSKKYGKYWRNENIILTGGFPCQPYSSAGKRLGKDDERHLFPEMLRVIQEIKPTFIVGENVYGLLNWNGGMVFEEVCADLENNGYEVQPILLPASGIGAPHHRGRIWFIAHTNVNESQCNGRADTSTSEEVRRQSQGNVFGEFCSNEDAPDTGIKGLQGGKIFGSIEGSKKKSYKQPTGLFSSKWDQFPTQSPICSGNDGLSNRLDGITISSWRKKSLQAYGNAIVPQLAHIIFQTIVKTKQNEQQSTGDGQHPGMD